MMSRFMCDAPLCSPILSGHINRFALSGSPMDTYHIFVRAYQSEVTTQVSSGRHLREPEGSRGSHLPTSSTIACAMGRRKLVGDLACSLFRAAKSQPLAKNTLSLLVAQRFLALAQSVDPELHSGGLQHAVSTYRRRQSGADLRE